MPLVLGKSQTAISKNIETEKRAHPSMSNAQAAAIAYHVAGDGVETPAAPETIRAAGIIFICGDNALFIQRSPVGDHAGEWCCPGGKIEEGESALAAAKRECREELGTMPKGMPILHSRRISTGVFPAPDTPDVGLVAVPPVDYTTFVLRVKDQFEPTLNEEHTGFAWAPLSNPPLPLHPGLSSALAKFTMNEYDVAEAIERGELSSPQQFMNVSLYDMRITGTGTAWRPKDEQIVFRPPENYLTPEFLKRCYGLPVIWKHPDDAILNSKEFGDRAVGTIILPYIKGDEVWGIARVYDKNAIDAMNDPDEPLSTSPSVVFRKGDGNTSYEQDGMKILIEGTPSLLDHLAICKAGVWDKGGLPSGIISIVGDSAMAEDKKTDNEMEKKNEVHLFGKKDEDEKKSDAAKVDETPDKTLALLDSVAKMCDSIGKRMDSMEERMKDSTKADARKADESKEEKKEEKADAKKSDEFPEKKEEKKSDESKDEKKDDSKKADEDEPMMDAAKADSADISARINAAVEAALKGKLPAVLTQADEAKFAAAQVKADSVFAQWGGKAPRWLPGESYRQYVRRLTVPFQKHSPRFKDADLTMVADDTIFDIAVDTIYADAALAAKNPADVTLGILREVITEDPTGRRIKSFNGRPRSWMDQFSGGRRRATFMERDKSRRA